MIRIITPKNTVTGMYINKSIKPIGTSFPVDIHLNRVQNDPLVDGNPIASKIKQLIKRVIYLTEPSIGDVLPIGYGTSISVVSDRLSPYYHDPSLLISREGVVNILLPSDDDSKREVVSNHITRALIRKMGDVDMILPEDYVAVVTGVINGSQLVNLERNDVISMNSTQVDDLAQDLSLNQKLDVSEEPIVPTIKNLERFLIQHELVTRARLDDILQREHKSRALEIIIEEAPNIIAAAACVLITADGTNSISYITRSTGYVYIASLGYDLLLRDFSVFTQSTHRWLASCLISLGIYALDHGSVTTGMIMILIGLITMSLFEKQINYIFDLLSDQLTRFIPWKKNK